MKDMEMRVWQRVRGEPDLSGEWELKLQIQNAQEMAAVYGNLFKNAGPQTKDLLRQLQEGEQQVIACLKGIGRLQGKPLDLKKLPYTPEPAAKALEKCYHRSRRSAMAFTAQSAGGEYGEVFRSLAHREGQHCVWIAQILGNL